MSFQDSPMAPAEEVATVAWNEYAEAAQVARAAWDQPSVAMSTRMSLHGAAIEAHDRFADAYRLLNEPVPPNLAAERDGLAIEGVALLFALAAFVGLFLPDFEAEFWPIAFTFIAVALLGAWTYRFAGRLARHLGRRL